MTDMYWTCEKDAEKFSCRSADEAVEAYLSDYCDMKNLPSKLTAYAHRTRDLDPVDVDAGAILESVLERLDDEYGGGDDRYEPTPALVSAAVTFAQVVAEEYQVWQCEPAEELNIEVDVQEWVSQNKPEWLDPKWPYVSTVKKEVKP